MLIHRSVGLAGRSNCAGGTTYVVALARGRNVVVVADRDEPGQRGAAQLASVLRLYCPTVRVITPPDGHKDVRVWRRRGATASDVMETIEAAQLVLISIRRM